MSFGTATQIRISTSFSVLVHMTYTTDNAVCNSDIQKIIGRYIS